MADEGDPTDQEEASSYSRNQAKDYQHGPETPKHCRKETNHTKLPPGYDSE